MLFALIHLLAGTVLSGILVTAAIVTPALREASPFAIPLAFLAGVILAIPVAWLVSRRLKANIRASRIGFS